ncbi:MAG: dipeptidyl aminopeptidase, partial [Actinobacteria bacterium]|nr:dipeptidyl aminopeptidase [Actinomycetota bacterium]
MSETGPKQHFSENQQMDFEVQAVLGGCYYGSADAGEVMVTIDRIREGDFESWVRHWHGTAGRVEKYAVESEEEGNRVSAREAFLRAASYYSATLSMIDGSRDPERRVPYWKQHMHCFERFCELLDPAGEKVEIPYEEKTMPGYFFRPPGSD